MAVRAKLEDSGITGGYVNNQRQKLTQIWNPTVPAPYVPPAPRTVRNVPPASAPKAAAAPARDYAAEAAAAAEEARKKAEAAEAAAKKAGKDQTKRENDATQSLIDTLLGTVKGYETGRDTQVKNANTTLQETLEGVLANLNSAVDDYEKTGLINDQDQAGKSAANVANRARERLSLLLQTASQGGGETDQLRAQLQAFQNADANQMEINQAYTDTARSIASQVAGANSQYETQRRSAWAQNQEAVGQAMSDFWKNWTDTFTNVQRTAAQNNNIDSDYSTKFEADFKGYDPVAEAAKWAGKAYEEEEKPEEFYKEGQRTIRQNEANSANRAASTTVGKPRAAEGATLRGRG